MTTMKRQSVSLPQDIADRVVALRKSDKYCRCSISEIMRMLIVAGLKSAEKKAQVNK